MPLRAPYDPITAIFMYGTAAGQQFTSGVPLDGAATPILDLFCPGTGGKR